MYKLTSKWHDALDMPKYDKEWHKNDIADEYKEYLDENNIIKKWSELSDVVYTHSRANWSGYKIDYPLNKVTIPIGLMYMYPKYSLRYLFYKRAGHKLNKKIHLKEVRNPKKIHKLKTIAQRNGLGEEEFVKTCQQLLKHWILIP